MNKEHEIKDAIEAIQANYPPANYTMLRKGLDLAITALRAQIESPTTDAEAQRAENNISDQEHILKALKRIENAIKTNRLQNFTSTREPAFAGIDDKAFKQYIPGKVATMSFTYLLDPDEFEDGERNE